MVISATTNGTTAKHIHVLNEHRELAQLLEPLRGRGAPNNSLRLVAAGAIGRILGEAKRSGEDGKEFASRPVSSLRSLNPVNDAQNWAAKQLQNELMVLGIGQPVIDAITQRMAVAINSALTPAGGLGR